MGRLFVRSGGSQVLTHFVGLAWGPRIVADAMMAEYSHFSHAWFFEFSEGA